LEDLHSTSTTYSTSLKYSPVRAIGVVSSLMKGRKE
jgi:hypothetical protein